MKSSSPRKHGYSVSYITYGCRCEECCKWNREQANKYLAANRDRINAQRRARWAANPDKYTRQLKKHRRFVSRYKMLVGCTRCGFRGHPFALTFHHRDPSTKSFQIGPSVTRALSKIKDEIRKCDVLCANCHAILEAEIREGVAK